MQPAAETKTKQTNKNGTNVDVPFVLENIVTEFCSTSQSADATK